jgi:hypothetical protein
LANYSKGLHFPCMYSRSLCEPKNVNSHVKVNFIFLVSWLKFGKKQVIAFIIQPSVLPPLPFSVSSQNKLNLVSPILSFSSLRLLSVSRCLVDNVWSGFGSLGGGMSSALVGIGCGWD